jgi:hypothetical protein
MKFNRKYFIPFLLLAIITSSCKKSYLEVIPYDGLALSVAITSETDLKAAVNGMYSAMRSYTIFGRYLPAKGDIMSDNVYTSVSNTGRQVNTYNLYTFTTSNAEARSIYGDLYIVIKRCNQVIASTVPASITVNQYKGEAYAARALCYLELVRNFAYPYATNSTGPGVPVITSFFSSEIKPARNTVAEVYVQIIADLNAAYNNMTIYTNNGSLSKYAAKAIQARAYMDMADWPNAKAAALDVVTNGGFTLTASTAYVSYWAGSTSASASKVEGIFSLICDATANNGNESLAYLYYQAGSYGDYVVNSQLYNLYAATDVRKSLIVPAVRGGYNIYASVKYPNSPSTSTNKDNIPVLRLSETLLILAESYYNTTDPVNALLNLNKVAKQRDPSFAGYASTGTQILEDILTEKRKELAFEGERYWDLYRLQRTFTKVTEQSLGTSINVVIPSTKGCRFPIPQAEVEANSNMKQNAEY